MEFRQHILVTRINFIVRYVNNNVKINSVNSVKLLEIGQYRAKLQLKLLTLVVEGVTTIPKGSTLKRVEAQSTLMNFKNIGRKTTDHRRNSAILLFLTPKHLTCMEIICLELKKNVKNAEI